MPVVTPETVRAQLTGGNMQPVYLLVGDDDLMLTALSNAIAGTLEEELRAFNYERLYATDKDVTPDAVIEAARILPMMGPRRVVTLLRAEKWLKPKRAGGGESAEEAESAGAQDSGGAEAQGRGGAEEKGAFAPLMDYIRQPVSSTVLVFVASDVNKSTALSKALYKSATVVECRGLVDRDGPRGGDVLRQGLALIKDAAAATGRQFEPAAAQLLAERSGGDIGKLRADVDHVLLFAQGKRAVTRDDVQAVVSERETVQDPWAMVNAIERGNAAEALRQLAIALEDGAVPVMVLGQLGWFVREKLPRLRPRQVPGAVQAVFRTDLDLKSSGGDPRMLLERLVLELCGAKR